MVTVTEEYATNDRCWADEDIKVQEDIPLSCSVYTKSKKAHIHTKQKNIDIVCQTNYRHDRTSKRSRTILYIDKNTKNKLRGRKHESNSVISRRIARNGHKRTLHDAAWGRIAYT